MNRERRTEKQWEIRELNLKKNDNKKNRILWLGLWEKDGKQEKRENKETMNNPNYEKKKKMKLGKTWNERKQRRDIEKKK